MISDTLLTITAAYIGSGCFIIKPSGYMAFVNKSNRPENLVIGKQYELVSMSIPYGQLYFVSGEVKV